MSNIRIFFTRSLNNRAITANNLECMVIKVQFVPSKLNYTIRHDQSQIVLREIGMND